MDDLKFGDRESIHFKTQKIMARGAIHEEIWEFVLYGY